MCQADGWRQGLVRPGRLPLRLTVGLNTVTTSRNGYIEKVLFSCSLRIFLVLFTPLDVNGATHDVRYLAVHGDIEVIPAAEFAGFAFNRRVKSLNAIQ